MITALGSPTVPGVLVDPWPGDEILNLASSDAWLARDVVVGAGSTVSPDVKLNRLVRIGSECRPYYNPPVHRQPIIQSKVELPGCDRISHYLPSDKRFARRIDDLLHRAKAAHAALSAEYTPKTGATA